jgi:hypothetical protein
MVSFNACLALACLRWLNSAEGRMHHVRPGSSPQGLRRRLMRSQVDLFIGLTISTVVNIRTHTSKLVTCVLVL